MSNFSLNESLTLQVVVAAAVFLTRLQLFLCFRVLQRNKIKSITKKAFEGLDMLEDL